MPAVTGGLMNRISQQRARARQWRMLLPADESATVRSRCAETTGCITQSIAAAEPPPHGTFPRSGRE